MKAMRGFIHVIEIIIVSLLVFMVIFQFSGVPAMETDWDKTKLSLQANDILFSMDMLGVNWLDANQVEAQISEFLPENSVYRVIIIDESGSVTMLVDNVVPTDSVTVSFYKIIGEQIYEIVLNVGYLY